MAKNSNTSIQDDIADGIAGNVVDTKGTPRAFDDNTLSELSGFDSALALLSETSGTVDSFDDYGNGFTILPTEEKNRLIKVPFVALQWRFHNGDNGEFVSVEIVTKGGEKLVVNDGSTGIRDQLKAVTDRRIKRGADAVSAHTNLYVSQGLRRSDYQYTDSDGKAKNATTYYLGN